MRLENTSTLHIQLQLIAKKRFRHQSDLDHPKECSLSLKPMALLCLICFFQRMLALTTEIQTDIEKRHQQDQQNPSKVPLNLRPSSFQGKCSRPEDATLLDLLPDLSGRPRLRQLQQVDSLKTHGPRPKTMNKRRAASSEQYNNSTTQEESQVTC